MYSNPKQPWLAGAVLPLLGLMALGCASQDRAAEIPETWIAPTGPQAEELSATAQNVREMLPVEALAVIDETDKSLAESDALALALKTGEVAPDFALPDALGKTVSLAQLLESGPVVLTFYRGHW